MSSKWASRCRWYIERRASLAHWLSSDEILSSNVDFIFFTSWSSDYRIWLIPTDFVARLSRSTSFHLVSRAEASRISSILAFDTDTQLSIDFRNPLSAFKGRQEVISTYRPTVWSFSCWKSRRQRSGTDTNRVRPCNLDAALQCTDRT